MLGKSLLEVVRVADLNSLWEGPWHKLNDIEVSVTLEGLRVRGDVHARVESFIEGNETVRVFPSDVVSPFRIASARATLLHRYSQGYPMMLSWWIEPEALRQLFIRDRFAHRIVVSADPNAKVERTRPTSKASGSDGSSQADR